jgi:hypothetical protein
MRAETLVFWLFFVIDRPQCFNPLYLLTRMLGQLPASGRSGRLPGQYKSQCDVKETKIGERLMGQP